MLFQDSFTILKHEISKILSLLIEIKNESKRLPRNLDFEDLLKRHISVHESIIKKFSEDLAVYNIKTSMNKVSGFLLKLDNTVNDLFSNERSGLHKSFTYYNLILNNKLYKRYFNKIKRLVYRYQTFINKVYISRWHKIKNIKDEGKIIQNLLTLFSNLKKELKSLKKVLERLVYSAELIDKKYANFEKESLQMRSEINKIERTLTSYKTNFKQKGGETIDGNITFFKVTNNFLKQKIDRLNKLRERCLVTFSEENDFSKKITELLQYIGNKIDLPRRELTLEFLLKFKKAFEKNNQHEMYKLILFYEKGGLYFPNVHAIGTNSGLTAYHGVVKESRKNGSWAHGGSRRDLEPEYYARRLKGILKEGLQPSPRQMSGGIDFPDGPGIYDIGNIYFYVKPHLSYGGNMISWNLNDYCVFQGSQHEFFIITPKNVPPNKLTLICRENQGPLYQELKKLNVQFKVFYESHAELHAPL